MNEYSEKVRKFLREAGADGPAKEVTCIEAALVRDAILGANPARQSEAPRTSTAEKPEAGKPVERAISPDVAKKDPLAALQAINAARAARGQQTANPTASNGPQRGQGHFGPGFGGGYGGGYGGGGFGPGHPVPLGPFHGGGFAQPRGALGNPQGQARGGFGPGGFGQGAGNPDEEEDF